MSAKSDEAPKRREYEIGDVIQHADRRFRVSGLDYDDKAGGALFFVTEAEWKAQRFDQQTRCYFPEVKLLEAVGTTPELPEG